MEGERLPSPHLPDCAFDHAGSPQCPREQCQVFGQPDTLVPQPLPREAEAGQASPQEGSKGSICSWGYNNNQEEKKKKKAAADFPS